jgi:hypothetical protein
MNLEQVILSQSKKVDSALATLKANRRYQQDKLAHDLDRVDLYVDGVEGDWLDNWTDSAEDDGETNHESISPSAVE